METVRDGTDCEKERGGERGEREGGGGWREGEGEREREREGGSGEID